MRLLATFAILASLACAQDSGKRFRLTGTVMDGASRQPLAGVELTIYNAASEPLGDSVFSDAQGQFGFAGLPAGEYQLGATGSFGSIRYGATPEGVSSIRLGTGDSNKSILFMIVPRASLEGTIRDEFGDVMDRANVVLLRPVWSGGTTTLQRVASKTTDDRGYYRAGNLAPGRYVVCASKDGTTAPVAGQVDYATRGASRAYARTCSPAPNGATPRTMQLTPGQHAQVDVSLSALPSASVSGTVRNSGSRAVSAYLVADDQTDSSYSVRFGGMVVNRANGPWAFTIPNIPQGRYRLRVDLPSGPGKEKHASADVPVEVNGTDVTGIDVTLEADSSVDVQIRGLTENGLDPAGVHLEMAGEAIAATGQPMADQLREVGPGIFKPTGQPLRAQRNGNTFHFDAVPPGKYQFHSRLAPGVCLEPLSVAGRDGTGGPLVVPGDSAVKVEASVTRNCGVIEMRAVSEGAAIAGAKVVLTSGRPKDPGEVWEDVTDDEGAFVFTGLTPGHYLLWTWQADDHSGFTGPSSLPAVEAKATAVDVKAGKPVSVDVPLLRPEGQIP